MSWLKARKLSCRDLVLMTAPMFVVAVLCKDLIDLFNIKAEGYSRSFDELAWGFRSRLNFILNHAIHIVLACIIIAAHFLPPVRFCRPAARLLAAGYNAAILLLVVYYFSFLS